MNRLQQKTALLETPQLYNVIKLIMESQDVDAGTALNAALEELGKRIPQADFVNFCDSL